MPFKSLRLRLLEVRAKGTVNNAAKVPKNTKGLLKTSRTKSLITKECSNAIKAKK